MPRTSDSLFEGKPLIEVAISQANLSPSTVHPQQPAHTFPLRNYKALLDTGATITCLSDSVVRECALQQFGLVRMFSGGGPNRHPSFIINLGIWCKESGDFEGAPEETRTLFQLAGAFEAVMIRDNHWFDVIIGMDIIQNHDLRMVKGGKFIFDLS